MELPEFGYIESDINHLTSIPILVVIPLLVVFSVYYWFRKKKKSVKEKGQSKWRLLPVGAVLCFAMLFLVWKFSYYGVMVFEGPQCKKHYPRENPALVAINHYKHRTKYPDIFYDFQAYRTTEFPWCPEDREAVEKMLGVYIEKEKSLGEVEK